MLLESIIKRRRLKKGPCEVVIYIVISFPKYFFCPDQFMDVYCEIPFFNLAKHYHWLAVWFWLQYLLIDNSSIRSHTQRYCDSLAHKCMTLFGWRWPTSDHCDNTKCQHKQCNSELWKVTKNSVKGLSNPSWNEKINWDAKNYGGASASLRWLFARGWLRPCPISIVQLTRLTVTTFHLDFEPLAQ